MVYDVYYTDPDGEQTKCEEMSDLCDIEDIACPKCGCDVIDWDGVDETWSTGELWTCRCIRCNHEFQVEKVELYKLAEEE